MIHARPIRSSLVIVRRLYVVIRGYTWSYVVIRGYTWFISDRAQVMRGAFVVHKHLLAMFGAYALICAEVRALLVICT